MSSGNGYTSTALAARVARWALAGVGLALAASGLGACASGDESREEPRGALPTGPAVRLPPPGRLFGFNDQAFAFTGGKEPQLDQGVTPARQLADTRAAGGNSARITVSWWDLEPRPGSINTAYALKLKAVTDPIERRGGRVVLVLAVPPPWASAKPGDARATIRPQPDAIRGYAQFAGTVARTWPRAAAIETWNEPNTSFFWIPREPEPEVYARMHRAAATAIRAESRGVRVLAGSVLGVPTDQPQIMSPEGFLRRAYAAGLRPRDYDGLAYHAYPAQEGGRVQPMGQGPFDESWRAFRRGYADADPRARLWITETGVSTSGPEAVDGEAQARGVTELLRRFYGQRRVEAVFVHSLYDVTRFPPGSDQRGFGVLESRGATPGSAKPAFCALHRLARSAPPDNRCD